MPGKIAVKAQNHMAEIEQHVKCAVCAYPFMKVFRRYTVRFGYGKYIRIFSENFAFPFIEKIENTFPAAVRFCHAGEPIRSVRRQILEYVRFFDVHDSINSETAYALIEPEAAYIIQCPAHLRIFPV